MYEIAVLTIPNYTLVEVKPECYVDDDCATSDICNKGSCVDACRLSKCGSNAICEAGFHSAKCVCLPGYTGDARTACHKCKLESMSAKCLRKTKFN